MKLFFGISVLVSVLSAAALTGCNGGSSSTPTAPSPSPTGVVLRSPGTPTNISVISISSTEFANGAVMPTSVALTACGGSNVSPDLSWTGAPANTMSYVLTEFDVDAPTGVGFWHWTLFNIPPNVTSLAAGAGTSPPAGTISGYTDWGSSGYGGPCPPVGDIPHHYIFTISALDIPTLSGVTSASTGAFLTFNMRGHIIAQGTYTGIFQR